MTGLDLQQSSVDGPGEQSKRSRRVLVVDDNVVNLKVACHMIRKLGYVADTCADGKQAVAAVREVNYGLVLMDCHMPVMDGYRATEVIRKLGGPSSRVPIVALTAHGFEENRRQCLATGMDDFLAKPVSVSALDKVLSDWLPGQ